jgi:ATP-grasp domain, R2K clade family 3
MLRCGWTPGGWCSREKLDCAAYYPHFADYLLNRSCETLPGVTAIREKSRLFAEFASDGKVFARPTSVHKLFVGRLIAEDNFETALAPTRYDPETQIIIAKSREIRREWRLVVAGDRVIAESQYADRGAKSIERGCPDEVRHFATAILAHVRWRPDDLFMLDVCETDEGFRLVELNSFSSSWLYACDFALVVETASEIATQAWERVQLGAVGTENTA